MSESSNRHRAQVHKIRALLADRDVPTHHEGRPLTLAQRVDWAILAAATPQATAPWLASRVLEQP